MKTIDFRDFSYDSLRNIFPENAKYNECELYFLNLVLIIPIVRFKVKRVAIRPSLL